MQMPQQSADIANIALSTFTSSAIVVYVMQAIKKSKWLSFVEEGKPFMNRAVSIIAALFTHLGLSFTWNASNHSLLIAGLSISSIATFVWQWANHYAMQEVMYQVAVNKPSGPSLGQAAVLEKKDAQVVAVSPQQAGK